MKVYKICPIDCQGDWLILTEEDFFKFIKEESDYSIDSDFEEGLDWRVVITEMENEEFNSLEEHDGW